MPFEQARAVCAPRARTAADQARAQAQDQERAKRAASPYSITTSGDVAAREAGNGAYSGCLAEQGWRLERRCVANCP